MKRSWFVQVLCWHLFFVLVKVLCQWLILNWNTLDDFGSTWGKLSKHLDSPGFNPTIHILPPFDYCIKKGVAMLEVNAIKWRNSLSELIPFWILGNSIFHCFWTINFHLVLNPNDGFKPFEIISLIYMYFFLPTLILSRGRNMFIRTYVEHVLALKENICCPERPLNP